MKEYYRDYILRVKPYLNLSAVCKACKVNRESLYMFLNGLDYALSEESLRRFVDFVTDL